MKADRVGSGLKSDPLHRAASFLRKEIFDQGVRARHSYGSWPDKAIKNAYQNLLKEWAERRAKRGFLRCVVIAAKQCGKRAANAGSTLTGVGAVVVQGMFVADDVRDALEIYEMVFGEMPPEQTLLEQYSGGAFDV